MEILVTLLTTLLVILAVFIILIVLLQSDKSSGMGILGGGGSQSAFGSSTADVLTKITGTMVALFMIIAFGLSVLESHRPKSVIDTVPSESPLSPPKMEPGKDKEKVPVKSQNKPVKDNVKKPVQDKP